MNALHPRHSNDLLARDAVASNDQDDFTDLVPLQFPMTFSATTSFSFQVAMAVVSSSDLGTALLTDMTNSVVTFATPVNYNAAANAINAITAQTTYNVTGAGIKIGILSDSFNIKGGESSAIANGYLPSNVTILQDGPATGADEGQAMAEIIHSIAPGASIYFYSAEDPTGGNNGETDFANGIAALVAAGCNIIVDDVSYSNEPFYQNAGPITLAAEKAVSQGVDYFTSAGNYASNYYEGTFTSVSGVTLPAANNGTSKNNTVSETGTGSAQTPYVEVNITPSTIVNFTLEWSQPFASTGGGHGSSYGIEVEFFDSNKNYLGTFNNGFAIGQDPVVTGTFTNSSSSSTVYMVFVQNGGVANGATFKILFEDNGGQITGGSSFGTGSGAIFGHAQGTGVNAVGAMSVSAAPSGTPEAFSSTGPGSIIYNTAGQKLTTPVTPGTPQYLGPDGSSTTIFDPFNGTSAAAPAAAAVAALVLQEDANLSTSQVTSLLKSTATTDGSQPASLAGSGLINANAAVAAAAALVACYCPGTLIETETGERPIETLAVGDLVRTVTGDMRPIRWIGRRSYSERFARRNPDLLPVIFRAGSLENAVPRRDLMVSPRHAMFLDGVLIQAVDLVNDVTILSATLGERVDYIHIELDSHDVILAEGAPSESFVDDESREMFLNAAEYRALYPDAVKQSAEYCAPRIDGGPLLQAVRNRLAHRAGLATPALSTGPMIGYVELIDSGMVHGWAQNTSRPNTPVCLDVVLDGVVIAQTLANLTRHDLAVAQFSSARHGFEVYLPFALDARQRQMVAVRRSCDREALPALATARAA